MFHQILIMTSPCAILKVFMASPYASSNFNYGKPICFIQINMVSTYVMFRLIMASPCVMFNHDELIQVLESLHQNLFH